MQEWVDPRFDLGVLEKRKSSLSLQGFESLKGLTQNFKFGRHTKNCRHDSLDKIRTEIVTLVMKNCTCFSRHCEQCCRYTHTQTHTHTHTYIAGRRVSNRSCRQKNMLYALLLSRRALWNLHIVHSPTNSLFIKLGKV